MRAIKSVILMCAGKGTRWGNHRGVPKHLVSVDGEMILDRSLRLIGKYTQAPVTIVAFDGAYDRPGHERLEPLHGPTHFCDTDKFLSSEPRWATDGDTVLVYGDVFFTEGAVQTIFEYQGGHCFFGRREGSFFTGCSWRELFAIRFPAREIPLLKSNLLQVRGRLLSGQTKKGGGWEVYEHMHGFSGEHFVTIDDFTEDFDFPEDFERWLRRYKNPFHRALVPLYGRALKRWHWRLERWLRVVGRNTGSEGCTVPPPTPPEVGTSEHGGAVAK